MTQAAVGDTISWPPSQSCDDSAKSFLEIPGYEFIEYIAEGGMGVVAKAHQRALNRVVAIKLLLARSRGSVAARQRFIREAQSAARLRHPNICPIFEVGEQIDQPYIVMAYIDGPTLLEWSKSAKPSPLKAAGIVGILARAVHYAHEHGVIHRDVKPSNVIVDAETGQPVLTDFGLAKELNESGPEVTRAGQLLGTPAYMAPEQATGHLGCVGPQTDVYALGAVLYELLCGRPPFLGSAGEIIRQVQTEEIVFPSKLHARLNRDLETICLKALAKEPADRYRSAEAFADDLGHFTSGEAIEARRTPAMSKLIRTARRSPVLTTSIALLVLSAFVAGHMAIGARDARRITKLAQAIETGLDGGDWKSSHLSQLNSLITEMETLDRERASGARQRLKERFASAIERKINRPRLEPGDIKELEEDLNHFSEANPELSTKLRETLERRLSAWQVLFQLAEPFDGRDAVFAPKGVEVKNNVLVRKKLNAGTPKNDLLLTRVPNRGQVQVEAVFEPSWLSTTNIGVALSASVEGGYEFVLKAAEETIRTQDGSQTKHSLTFEQSRFKAANTTLQIMRRGIPLREQTIPALTMGQGLVRLRASRNGDILTAQLNDLAPLVYQDIFPITETEGGVLGLIWPSGVALQQYSALHQTLAVTPSPLERGDNLCSHGKFDDALAYYRQQTLTGTETRFQQEAKLKAALCLLELNRTSEAIAVLEELAVEPGERWPVVAACRLWLLLLEQNRMEEANAIQDSLAPRYEFEQVAVTVPISIRQKILEKNRIPAGFDYYRFDSQRVQKLERFDSLQALLQGDIWQRAPTKWALIRALHDVEDFDRALRRLDESIRLYGFGAYFSEHEEYSWILRQEDRATEALGLINRWINQAATDTRSATKFTGLQLERIRVLTALGRWDQAQRDLESYMNRPDLVTTPYPFHASGWLMIGFLREHFGNSQGATAAWTQGRHKTWLARGRTESVGSVGTAETSDPHLTGLGLAYYTILESLTDSLSEEAADEVINTLAGASATDSPAALLKGGLRPPPTVLRRMWQNPRAHNYARQIAFQELSFPKLTRLLPLVGMAEVFRQGAFGGSPSPEQENVIWELAETGQNQFYDGRLSVAQIIQLGLTWKGLTNVLGWAGVGPTLKPEFRGIVAYVFGHRYLTLDNRDQSKRFLEISLADAAPDSLLKRLAKSELKRFDEPRKQ